MFIVRAWKAREQVVSWSIMWAISLRDVVDQVLRSNSMTFLDHWIYFKVSLAPAQRMADILMAPNQRVFQMLAVILAVLLLWVPSVGLGVHNDEYLYSFETKLYHQLIDERRAASWSCTQITITKAHQRSSLVEISKRAWSKVGGFQSTQIHVVSFFHPEFTELRPSYQIIVVRFQTSMDWDFHTYK